MGKYDNKEPEDILVVVVTAFIATMGIVLCLLLIIGLICMLPSFSSKVAAVVTLTALTALTGLIAWAIVRSGDEDREDGR